ncbi:hypothetical protein [Streptomyces zingiberis]|uniref:Zinc-finger domain-containing protein n=1 Tax=Streptomyces zingiberis TaxID=2053010 RepID=A0ABX1BTQ0_9ACTN|nr:hypothetical protein [Streptomyces zingiberis]NJP99229.1 hypothetical protein [Streptomyces zingiberis]
MTSTIGADGHPDVEEISALMEGALPPGLSSAVRAHLGDCELCAEVQASLREIRSLLGTLPEPPRMPADVAGRIDAAIAAESLLAATAPRDVSRETGPPTGAAPVSRETDRSPSPAPVVTSPPRGRTSRTERPSGSGPGRGPSRRRRRSLTLGLACALGLALGGVAVVQALGPASRPTGTPAKSTDGPVESAAESGGSEVNAATLEGTVHRLLAAQPSPPGEQSAGPPADEMPDTLGARSAPAQPLRGDDAALPSCIRNGIDNPVAPLAAEEGTFEGKAAYIVIFPHPSDRERVETYVVDSSCVTTAEPRGDVLLSRTYPRH